MDYPWHNLASYALSRWTSFGMMQQRVKLQHTEHTNHTPACMVPLAVGEGGGALSESLSLPDLKVCVQSSMDKVNE